MKPLRFSLFAVIATIAIIPALAPAQSTATLVSLRGGGTSVIAMPSVSATAHDVLGLKGFDLSARPFGSFDLSTTLKPGAGLAISFERTISREYFGQFGFYVRGRLETQPDAGFFFAVGKKF